MEGRGGDRKGENGELAPELPPAPSPLGCKSRHSAFLSARGGNAFPVIAVCLLFPGNLGCCCYVGDL